MPSGSFSLHPITKLRGVGPKISESLNKLNIRTVEDALFHLPYRYEDRTKITNVNNTPIGLPALLQGEIISSQIVFRGRRMLFAEIYDGTGRFKMRLFHFAMAQKNNLKKGLMIRCYGVVQLRPTGKEMIHPQYQVFNKGEIPPIDKSFTPVYSTTTNLQQGRLRNLIKVGLSLYSNNILPSIEDVVVFPCVPATAILTSFILISSPNNSALLIMGILFFCPAIISEFFLLIAEEYTIKSLFVIF